MSNNKQSSLDWLLSNISSKIDNEYWCNQKEITEFVEQAKAMHKEEIEDAYTMGSYDMVEKEFRPEQYYNETFGGNDEQD
jgi:hypothetical protein